MPDFAGAVHGGIERRPERPSTRLVVLNTPQDGPTARAGLRLLSEMATRNAGGIQNLAIAHIFPCHINGLPALLEVVSFWAEPLEGLRFV